MAAICHRRRYFSLPAILNSNAILLWDMMNKKHTQVFRNTGTSQASMAERLLRLGESST